MENNKMEYIKVACLIVIAVSLTAIAWNTVTQVNVLQDIQDSLYQIGRLKENWYNIKSKDSLKDFLEKHYQTKNNNLTSNLEVFYYALLSILIVL